MRGGFKLLLIVGALVGTAGILSPAAPGAVAATPGPSPSSVTSPPPLSATDQLKAHRAQLEQQLLQANGVRADAKQQLLAAESQLSDVEKQIAASQKTLDEKDAELKHLTARIAQDEQSLNQARGQLAALLRSTYEVAGSDGFAGAILTANDFSQALDRIRGAQHVTDQLQILQKQVDDAARGLLTERAAVQRDFSAAQQLEGTLNEQSGRLIQAVAERDLAFKRLDGPARTLASQIAVIDDQLAPVPAPVAAAPALPAGTAGPQDASAPCGNRFAFGNCTYYVASRRCIPWLGNAWEWWGSARAAGYSEGQVPQRGAVAVWGQGGYSPVGHVAYVEAVGPAPGVPAGSFLVSEMNYVGFDRVSYRVVPLPSPNLLGFIYGHG